MTAQIASVLGPAPDEPGALQQPSTVHVSEGVISDTLIPPGHVGFSPNSDRLLHNSEMTLYANSDQSEL